jgi:hypothetical protein
VGIQRIKIEYVVLQYQYHQTSLKDTSVVAEMILKDSCILPKVLQPKYVVNYTSRSI